MVAQVQSRREVTFDVIELPEYDPGFEIPREDTMAFSVGAAVALPVALALWGVLLWVVLGYF